MDIQTEKLNLIKWLAGLDDIRIIQQFLALKKVNQEQVNTPLTSAEKSAIDQGLKSIEEGKTHSHESVMQSTRKKYPNLYK